MGVLCIALTLLLVFSRSSLANISLFLYIQKVIKYFLLIIPLIAGLFLKVTRRDLIIFPLLLVFAFIGARLAKDTAILQIVVLAFGLRGIKANSLVNLFLWSSIAGTTIIILGTLLGIFTQVQVLGTIMNIKTSFGFILPNTAGLQFLLIILLLIVKSSYKHAYAYLMIPFLFLLYLTGARTSQGLALLALGMFLVLKMQTAHTFLKRHTVGIIMVLFIGAVAFSIVTVMMYSDGVMQTLINKLNTTMSGRLKLGSTVMDNYGLTLFGQHIPYSLVDNTKVTWVKTAYLWLDNAYLKLIFNFGCIWLVVYFLAFWRLAKEVSDSDNFIFIIPMVVIILLGISESAILYYWFNFICFAFVADFSKSNQSSS